MDTRFPGSNLILGIKTLKHRPLSVTLLSGLVLTLAVINLARMGQAVARWKLLENLLPFHPSYLVITGLTWGAIGFAAALLIWSGWAHAPLFTAGYLLSYSAFDWADRLWMPGFPGKNANWPFVLGLNAILIAWSIWVLTRSKARKFFEAGNER